MAHKLLKNVVLEYCFFHKVDQYGKYGCRIILNKAQAKEMTDWGLKVKKDTDGTLYFRARRAEDKGPVLVKDAELNIITDTPTNGATANVIFDVYQYKTFGGGIAARIEKVQLLNWEPYGSSVDFEAEAPIDAPDSGGASDGEEPDLF